MPRSSVQALELDLPKVELTPRRDTANAMIARIEGYIENPPRDIMFFEIEPIVADFILKKYNVGNRTRKPSKIAEYATDMAADDWHATHEPLKFSDAKRLRDGQNRLYACIKAQKPFKTHIAFGVPDGAFVKMDSGKNRSGGDLLQIAGYTNTNHLAAGVRWVHLFETGRARQRDTFSPAEILVMLQTLYGDLPDYMLQAGRIYQVTGQPKGLVAALLRQFHRANPEKAAAWAEAWEKGKDAGVHKPLGLVTRRIAEIKTASQGPVQDIVRAALLIQAWNLFIAGKKGIREDINWTMSDDFPAITG